MNTPTTFLGFSLAGALLAACAGAPPEKTRPSSIIAETPGTAEEDLKQKALTLLRDQKFDEALAVVTEAIVRDSADPGLYNLRARVYAALRRPDPALADGRTAMALGDTVFNGLLAVAFFHFEEADCQRTVDIASEILRRDDGDFNALNLRAAAYRYQKRYDLAAEDYRKILDAQPDQAVMIRNLANCHRLRGDAPAALREYEKALALDSTDLDALSGISYVHFDMGDMDKAVEAQLRIAERDSTLLGKSKYAVACFHALKKNNATALKFLGEALEAGYDNFRHLKDDPDLEGIRGTKEYARLLKKYWPAP